MPYEKDPNELGVLWLKSTQGGDVYMSGEIGGQKVVVFRTKKKEGSKGPDWRVLKSILREERAPSSSSTVRREKDARMGGPAAPLDRDEWAF